MNPEQIATLTQALRAKLDGRPRWGISDNRKKALFIPKPGEYQEIDLAPPQTPIGTHAAAESHFQTEALFLIAANLGRIAAALETQTPNR